MRDPIIIDPPGFNPADGWKQCQEDVERAGGLDDIDGYPNWLAAFAADPGCCTCPNCKAYYWAWGRVIQCLDCGFQFSTDWWPMYSWGVQAAKERRADRLHEKRMNHPYYRYGFEHPVDDAWEEHDKINWKAVLPA